MGWQILIRLLAGLRAVVYMACFVLLWGWIALGARRFDPSLGITLPAWLRYVGVGAMVAGGGLALSCAAFFAIRGEGTPAPFDPPRRFVASGPYRWVRNPMYVGGLVVLAGFGLFLASVAALLLAALAAALVHAFVVWIEEPGLESRFGQGYRQYKAAVGRWWPRWR